MNNDSTIKEQITQWRDNWKKLGSNGLWLYHEFVLRNGKAFPGRDLPKRYVLGLPKYCYTNSRATVLRSRGKLRYCEGFVLAGDIGMLIEHAWAIDEKDRVVDVTLQDFRDGTSRSALADYYGVVFSQDWLRSNPKKRYCGLLHTPFEGYDVDLMVAFDPGFNEMLAQAQKMIGSPALV